MSKKINEKDVFETYKASYRLKFPWGNILDEQLSMWLTNFEKATNCPRNLLISALLSMTSAVCGPNSYVTSNDSFRQSLNCFLIAVCDPGGGKSITFDKVIAPVMESIERKVGTKVMLETYTTAGIHKQQVESGGYGLICSDEGERFLSLINFKQRQGDSERALLCKLWQGRGDSSSLANGTRGFDHTSMSTCILIQPYNFVNEMAQFTVEDGLLDRFLVVSARPTFRKTSEVIAGIEQLRESRMTDFVGVFEAMFAHHKTGVHYTLSEEAQLYYNLIVDNYASIVNSKYLSESEDEDKENITDSQNTGTHEQTMTTSKDTCHILRLSVVLHVLSFYWNMELRGNETASNSPTTEVPLLRVQQAQALYSVIIQHKAIYLQTLKTSRDDGNLRLKIVKTFRERVTRSVCRFPGPLVCCRDLQKRIRGALSENVKRELEELENQGFGVFRKITIRGCERWIFFKISGGMIDTEIGNHNAMLKMAETSLEEYTRIFSDISKTQRSLIFQHPYVEEFRDTLPDL